MAIPGKLEAAIGGDRTADPWSLTYTDLTADTAENQVTITRGKSDAGQDVTPGSMPVTLRNASGQYTPRFPTSAYYPNIKRGLLLRHSMPVADEYLLCPGSGSVSTPDSAALDVTDLAGAVEFDSPVSTPPGSDVWMVTGKYTTAGNQRSWFFRLESDGRAGLGWSTDGTSAGARTESMTLGFPRPDAGPITVGWWLDINDGSGNHVLTWYYVRGTVADLLADPDAFEIESTTTAGTTGIFNSTSGMWVGNVNGIATAGFTPFIGQLRHVQIRNGDLKTGTIVANPDFTGRTAGDTGFTDSAGRVWTVNAPEAISNMAVRFSGELVASNPTWPGHGVASTAQVRWEVAGPFRRMRQGNKPLLSALNRRITAPNNLDNVIAYWPMEDGREATSLVSPIDGVEPMTIDGTFSLAATTTLDSSAPLPNFPASQTGSFRGFVPPNSATQQRVDVLAFIETPHSAGTAQQVIAFETEGSAAVWGVYVNEVDVSIVAGTFDGTFLLATTIAADDRFFNTWVIWSLSISQSGGNVAWDLDIIPIPLGSVFGTSGSFAATWGRISRAGVNVASAPPAGVSFGHLAVTTGVVSGWLAGADIAYKGEPASARVYRLCKEQGIPVFVDGQYTTSKLLWDSLVTAGYPPMGAQRPLPLLTLLQECATVSRGQLGESRVYPGIVYKSGPGMLDQSPRLSVSGDVEAVPPFNPAEDDQRFVNEMTASRPNGSAVKVTAETPNTPDEVGLYDKTQEFNCETDGQLSSLASWTIHEVTVDEMRYPAIAMELVKGAYGNLPDWLAMTPGDILEVDDLPSTHFPTPITQMLEGYTEEIDPFTWRVTAVGAPATPWTVGVLDDDASPGTAEARVDTDGSELAVSRDSTQTSWSVSVTVGPLWTTAAGDFPMRAMCEGEELRVTAIAGGASPQTWTVVRSVNGVVKSHTAGAVITALDAAVVTL